MITAQEARQKTDKAHQKKLTEKSKIEKLEKQRVTRLRNKYRKSSRFATDVKFVQKVIDEAISQADYRVYISDGDTDGMTVGSSDISLTNITLYPLSAYFTELGYTIETWLKGQLGHHGGTYFVISW